MTPGRPENSGDRSHAPLGWLFLLLRALSTPLEVSLLRSGFGERYLGLQALIGIFLVPLFATGFPDRDPRPLLLFLAFYVVMLAVTGVRVQVRRWLGDRTHSYYSGRPRIMRLLPRLNEATAKRFVDPLLIFLVTLFVMPYSEPLGAYLLVSGFALFVNTNAIYFHEHTRAMNLADAAIEDRQLMEQVRHMVRDRL